MWGASGCGIMPHLWRQTLSPSLSSSVVTNLHAPPPVPWCACASPDKLHADNTFQYSAPWPVALWSCAKQDPGQPVRVPLAVLGKLLQVARVPTAKDAKLRPAIEAPAFSEAEWQKMKVVAKLRFEGSQ